MSSLSSARKALSWRSASRTDVCSCESVWCRSCSLARSSFRVLAVEEGVVDHRKSVFVECSAASASACEADALPCSLSARESNQMSNSFSGEWQSTSDWQERCAFSWNQSHFCHPACSDRSASPSGGRSARKATKEEEEREGDSAAGGAAGGGSAGGGAAGGGSAGGGAAGGGAAGDFARSTAVCRGPKFWCSTISWLSGVTAGSVDTAPRRVEDVGKAGRVVAQAPQQVRLALAHDAGFGKTTVGIAVVRNGGAALVDVGECEERVETATARGGAAAARLPHVPHIAIAEARVHGVADGDGRTELVGEGAEYGSALQHAVQRDTN